MKNSTYQSATEAIEKSLAYVASRKRRIEEAQEEFNASFAAYLDVKEVLEKHSLTVFSGAQELKMFLLNDAKHALDYLVELVKDEQR